MKTIALLTLGLGLLITMPTMAQLGNVLADFQAYSGDLQIYLRNKLRPTLKPVEIQSQNALYNATGELNIPNPIAAGDRLSNEIILNSITDRFNNNSVVKASTANNEISRLLTRSSVESLLGYNGQVRTKLKLENVQNTLQSISELAQEADSNYQNISGNLQSMITNLANMSGLAPIFAAQSDLQLQNLKIQSEQSKLVAESLAQTMQVNHFLQYSNLNLASISQQMEENNRARRVDASAEAARLLRTTSQMDLFGRREVN